MTDLLAGGSALAAAAIALYFMRFWRQTRDSFFALFALAFVMFVVNRALVAVVDDEHQSEPWLYLPRLFAFLLIIAAIVYKNRADELS